MKLKKILSISNTVLLLLALFSFSAANAAEITGTLSSAGVSHITTSQGETGTLAGTVTGGSGTIGGSTSGGSGGGSTGGSSLTGSVTGGGSNGQLATTIVPAGSVLGAATGPTDYSNPSNGGSDLAQANTGDVSTSTDYSDATILASSTADQNSNQLAAVGASGFDLGTWSLWILLLLALIVIIYYIYKRYSRERYTR